MFTKASFNLPPFATGWLFSFLFQTENSSFKFSPHLFLFCFVFLNVWFTNYFNHFFFWFSGGHVEVPPPAAGGEQEAGGADQNPDHEEGEAAASQRSAISAFHP